MGKNTLSGVALQMLRDMNIKLHEEVNTLRIENELQVKEIKELKTMVLEMDKKLKNNIDTGTGFCGVIFER